LPDEQMVSGRHGLGAQLILGFPNEFNYCDARVSIAAHKGHLGGRARFVANQEAWQLAQRSTPSSLLINSHK